MDTYLYIFTPLIAWAIAQGGKRLFVRYNRKRKVLDQPESTNVVLPFAPSGGMPSAHSATVVALAAIIGLKLGISSPEFAIALLFAAVAMYDAMMVRYSSGEQGEAIISLLKESHSKVRPPKVAKGHLPIEVAVGVVIGVAVACVVYLATK